LIINRKNTCTEGNIKNIIIVV